MQVTRLEIEGLLLVELKVHRDARGFFTERFNEKTFAELGLPVKFVQDNHSRSIPGVTRGLHFQAGPAQGKLVGVASGSVWDVAVDVRAGSPTFGKYVGVELSGENGRLLWIPPGFAHGFTVLGDRPADMLYKVTAFYNPKAERGLRWDDPELKIQWPSNATPLLSDADNRLGSFAEYRKNPVTDWS